MTAEVAVMNKLAVALAADSAVTVRLGGNTKIYNSVNKLFRLSHHHPVGIMVYGGAELLGVPWETIIKLYREHLRENELAHVPDYAQNFREFLASNTVLFPADVQLAHAKGVIADFLEMVLNESLGRITTVLEERGELTEDEAIELVDQDITEWVDAFKEAGEASGVPKNHEKALKELLGGFSEKVVAEVFMDTPLSKRMREKLEKLCIDLFMANKFHDGASGVVIAGFGSEDIYPSLCSFHISEVLLGVLRYNEAPIAAITDRNSASIVPFAQGDMIATFMEGIDPELDEYMMDYLHQFLADYGDAVSSAVPKLTAEERKDLAGILKNSSEQGLKDFYKEFAKLRHARHTSSTLEAVSVLPKDELGAMAESLINLTSLKRRVSRSAETVGGAVDVAVISKGDGFIYLKHKHYFEPELNRNFFMRRALTLGEKCVD